MRLDLYVHLDETAFGGVTRKLDQILTQLEKIMTELDTLTAQVQANEDAEASALVLIQGIAARITAAGVDPAKLASLTASLKTSGDALAAAVVANTPAAQ